MTKGFIIAKAGVNHNGSEATAQELGRPLLVAWTAACDFMIGNCSAGIIVAALFGITVLNLGSRQKLRERNAIVVDLPLDQNLTIAVVVTALVSGSTGATYKGWPAS